MSMRAAHEALTRALEPLGIEVGLEVLDVWSDRLAHGQEPIPAAALCRLAEVVDQLLLDAAAATRSR